VNRDKVETPKVLTEWGGVGCVPSPQEMEFEEGAENYTPWCYSVL